jgi:hypothetical protein
MYVYVCLCVGHLALVVSIAHAVDNVEGLHATPESHASVVSSAHRTSHADSIISTTYILSQK